MFFASEAMLIRGGNRKPIKRPAGNKSATVRAALDGSSIVMLESMIPCTK